MSEVLPWLQVRGARQRSHCRAIETSPATFIPAIKLVMAT